MRTTLLVVITSNHGGLSTVISVEKFVFERSTDAALAKRELIGDYNYTDNHDGLSVKVTLLEGTK